MAAGMEELSRRATAQVCTGRHRAEGFAIIARVVAIIRTDPAANIAEVGQSQLDECLDPPGRAGHLSLTTSWWNPGVRCRATPSKPIKLTSFWGRATTLAKRRQRPTPTAGCGAPHLARATALLHIGSILVSWPELKKIR